MAPAPLKNGDPARIGRYRLSARLGAGGMGVVYLGTARDGTLAAIKVLRAELADDPEFRARFRREVAALDRVSGICTVRVLEADTESDRPFLTTEYAAGPTLAEHVGDFGPLAPPMLYGLATGLAEALTAIHAAGIVHRDLKPGNVLLTPGGPKVIDFGIAQALDFTSVTRTGLSVGSPGFMAPEQVRGQAGQPADVFAWALTVGYAASGQPPFGAGTPDAIFYRVLHDDPDTGAVPDQLRPLVEQALAKDPGERPAAPDLLQRLAAASGEPEAGASTAAQRILARTWISPAGQPPTVMGARRRRNRAPAAVVLLVLAAIGTGLGFASLGGTTQPVQQPVQQPAQLSTTEATASPSWSGDPSSPYAQPSGSLMTTALSVPTATALPASTATALPASAATALPASTPSDVSSSLAAYPASATEAMLRVGYAPAMQGPPWDNSATLNAIIGHPYAMAGPGMKVFFFAGGRWVGVDSPDDSLSLTSSRVSGTEIAVRYSLYDSGDLSCCPNGGSAAVRFDWKGGTLVALDPIPPPAYRDNNGP
jgi:eukaryotic-like serine/threonine-protein kinase